MISNLRFNKSAIISLLSISILTTTLVGCKNENTKVRSIESNEEIDSFDLKNNENYVIIETIDSAGNKGVHFAEKIRLSHVDNPIKEVNKYSDYTDINKALPTNTYLYLDLDGDVLAVQYTDPNIYNRSDLSNESYLIKDVISEKNAYSEAVNYYGEQDSYSKEEIELMMLAIKEEYRVNQKTK